MIDVLKEIKFFKDLTNEQLVKLSDYLTPKDYLEDQNIFSEGDISNGLYIIEDGEIKIFKKIPGSGQKTLAQLFTYDVFGEMSLLDGKKRSASATAVTGSKLIHLTIDNFQKLIKNESDIALKFIYHIALDLAQKLRSTNEQVIDMVIWGLNKKYNA